MMTAPSRCICGSLLRRLRELRPVRSVVYCLTADTVSDSVFGFRPARGLNPPCPFKLEFP
jgi:hypothetical protein